MDFGLISIGWPPIEFTSDAIGKEPGLIWFDVVICILNPGDPVYT